MTENETRGQTIKFTTNRFGYRVALVILAVGIASAFLYSLSTQDQYQSGDRLPTAFSKKPGHLDSSDSNSSSNTYRDITWDNLLPEGWDPTREIKSLDLARLSDESPYADAALVHMRFMWASAPAEPSMDGVKVHIAGFAVPLEYKGDDVSELLLVPYFGACIHMPPPPANQIIHVFVGNTLKELRTMTPIWVKGTLNVDRSRTDMGFSTYSMRDAQVELFDEPNKTDGIIKFRLWQ